jgi:hypothetical protein
MSEQNAQSWNAEFLQNGTRQFETTATYAGVDERHIYLRLKPGPGSSPLPRPKWQLRQGSKSVDVFLCDFNTAVFCAERNEWDAVEFKQNPSPPSISG